MKHLVILAAVLALAVPTAFAAKERGNRTKCGNAIKRVGDIRAKGIAAIQKIALAGLVEARALANAGDKEGADEVAAEAVRGVEHRGHVTVLKLHATTNGCTGQAAKRSGIDPELVATVESARDKAAAAIDLEEQRAVKVLGDIFGDPDYP